MGSLIVEVIGYESRPSDERMAFAVDLPFTPAAGDDLILEPGPTWGRIECTVLKRVISARGVTVVARVRR